MASAKALVDIADFIVGPYSEVTLSGPVRFGNPSAELPASSRDDQLGSSLIGKAT
jgi:hypothetical protein